MPLCQFCGENVELNKTVCTSCGRAMGARTERLNFPNVKESKGDQIDNKESFESKLLNSMSPMQFLALLLLIFLVWRFGKDWFWILAGDRPLTLVAILIALSYGLVRVYVLVRKWYYDSDDK